jgi:hypothetical protein
MNTILYATDINAPKSFSLFRPATLEEIMTGARQPLAPLDILDHLIGGCRRVILDRNTFIPGALPEQSRHPINRLKVIFEGDLPRAMKRGTKCGFRNSKRRAAGAWLVACALYACLGGNSSTSIGAAI